MSIKLVLNGAKDKEEHAICKGEIIVIQSPVQGPVSRKPQKLCFALSHFKFICFWKRRSVFAWKFLYEEYVNKTAL